MRVRAIWALAALAQAEPSDSQAIGEVLRVLEQVKANDPSELVREQAALTLAKLGE